MACSRNKVTHSTSSVLRVKNPAERFSKVVTIIHDPRDMNQLDNLLFSSVLDFEILTHLPSIITTSVMNFIDALHKHKPILNRQDLPTLPLTLILVQATHLNSQISHYGNCQDDCIDST